MVIYVYSEGKRINKQISLPAIKRLYLRKTFLFIWEDSVFREKYASLGEEEDFWAQRVV